MLFYVYITTNPSQTALYVGVTNNLQQRIIEHYLKRGKPETHAGRYFCYLLVFYETHRYVKEAIKREKEIKKWRNEKKMALIRSFNREYRLLNAELFGKWPPRQEELFHRQDH